MWHAWERRGNCTRFCWESLKERDHFEDPGVDGKMGPEFILGSFSGGVGWIQPAKDKARWQALVNAVMNLRVLETLI
jgi:hypothetical protein